MRFSFPQINHVALIVIIVQFIINISAGLLGPIFAVFVTNQIAGGAVTVIGFAIMIYWATKSVLQLFVARYIDRNHGEIDDFYAFLLGGILSAIFISLYYFVTDVWHIYALQFALGIADAFFVPPFYAIFTRHIDKGKEGFEWSLYSSFSIGAGTAIGGALGGIFGTVAGFRIVFLIAGLLGFIATGIIVFLRPYLLFKVPQDVKRFPMDPKDITGS